MLQVIYWLVRGVWQELPTGIWEWGGIAVLYALYGLSVSSIADAAAAAHMASVGTAGAYVPQAPGRHL